MLIEELRTLFLFAYLIFVIWSLIRWVHVRTSREPSLRGRAASIGLIVGSVSAVLFTWFYVYLWMARSLPAHGLTLWTLILLSEGLAVAGVILGALGTGWVRQPAFLISLVMVFQWWRELASGPEPARLIDGSMFASLALFGLALLGYRYFTRNLRHRNT